MPGKELFPNQSDNRGNFRHGTNRQVEITLRKELDDVAKKSFQEIIYKKDQTRKAPLDEAEYTSRRLQPAFVPQKVKEKRKTQPVFHDDLPAKGAKKEPKFQLVPTIPSYNPLDKSGALKPGEKTRKYPYVKDDTITTKEMRKPHVTSLGVTPARESTDVPVLKVVMEGKNAMTEGDSMLDEIAIANKMRPTTPVSPDQKDEELEEEEDLPTDRSAILKKPAILSSEGTTARVQFMARQKPVPPATSLKKYRRKTAAKSSFSMASSLQSDNIQLPDEAIYSQYDEVIAGIDADLENVQTQMKTLEDGQEREGSKSAGTKSSKELLEEARRISRPGSEVVPKQKKKESPRKRDGKKEGKKSGKDKSKGKAKETEKEGEVKPRTERTVDEIIASLRAGSGKASVSEADRKIQEIMDRVMSHAGAVLRDEQQVPTPEVVEEPQKPAESDSGTDVDPHSSSHTPYESGGISSPTTGGELSGLSTPYDHDEKKDVSVPDQIAEEREVITDRTQQDEEATADQPSSQVEKPEEEPTSKVELKLSDFMTSTDNIQPPEVKAAVSFEVQEDDDRPEMPPLDIRQVYEDLMAPPEATYEDMVSIEGKFMDLADRQVPKPVIPQSTVQSSSVSFLSSWKPMPPNKYPPTAVEKDRQLSTKNIHHFCTLTSDYQLPDEFHNLGRKYHTPNKYEKNVTHPYRFGSTGPSIAAEIVDEETASQISKVSETRAAEEERLVSAARRVLMEADKDAEEESREDSFEIWKQRAEEVFTQPDIAMEGAHINLKNDESRLFWAPAPPKLDVPPTMVKEVLFPEYQPSFFPQDSRAATSTQQDEFEDSEEEEEEEDVVDADQERYNETFRLIYHKSESSEDLTQLMVFKQQREEDIKARKIDPYEKRKLLKGEVPQPVEELTTPVEEETRESTPIGPEYSKMSIDYIPVFPLLRRSKSDPSFIHYDDDTLIVPQDYNTAMDEIRRQKRSIKQMKINRRLEEIKKLEEEENESSQVTELPQEPSQTETLVLSGKKKGVTSADTVPRASVSGMKLLHEPTPAELALEAGRAYVILPKKSKKKKKRAPVSMSRLEDIEKFLNSSPRIISRRSSMISMPKSLQREFRVPPQVKSRIRKSIPDLLDFKEYSSKKGYRKGEDMREWVRDIWNKWFDEVFPPSESEEDEEDEVISEVDGLTSQDVKTDKKRRESVTSSLSESFDVIEPIDETEENMELIQIIVEEIEKLDAEIGATKKPRAFLLCRRGALCRKIGMIKQAEEDLNRAIKIEPLILDAYWHRHLLYLLQDNKQGALDDLHFILKHSKKHSGAYRSIAEIYRKQGDITKAVVNYSQAIKQNPQDHEAYFQRALMYEKRGEMLLALEDLSKVKKIKPTRTDAILKHGMYYFENKNWTNAINDFTDLLKVEPLNASARMYRGRAYAHMQDWTPAVQDLSAAIHLDPNSWRAFYHRACILRNAHPRRALHDYSVSLLINDTEENVMSYLHRGILYDAMGRHEDAIPDFESVLKLNKDIACAHTNLGLIFMNHYENYHRAIKKFSSGIKVDPTYVRAYVCRGEAYHKIHELKLSLRDFTRAIHLRPDVHHYYMYRGQLVLEMGNLDLAAFCVRLFMMETERDFGYDVMAVFRHASEMSTDSSLGQMPTQQAVVQSFLKNYDRAIEALEIATRANPKGSLFMLLGKTQMKAKRYMGAAESFKKAIQVYTPWKPREPWPQEAAEAHYLIGMCHMELKNYLEALSGFTEAIKLDANYAEALYQRGVAKMKQHISKGIQDFNKALAINPRIFQAYLSRACYYGYKKNYTKAILNCNEAIKLQPKSVRAYLYRGALKYHIKAFDLAIRDLTTAASIDSQCSLAYFNRAVCYQEKKDYQKALTDYGIVLLLGQDLTLEVYINRGLLYFERKDYINALYDFKLAAKLKKDQRILHTLGLCYHKMDKLRDALDVFTSCVNNNPSFLEGIIARGNVYMDFGGEEGLRYARRDYERALMKDPLCLPARVNLAYTLQVSEKYMQAWVQFTTAIALKPTFKPALEGRAIINLQMSNTFAAFQDINASLKIGATAELYTNRGVINQFMQDRVNAMRDYQMALQLDPTYALAYFNAANVYFHTRHFRQALDYYGKAITYKPKDESAYLNRAITKVMLQDFQGALEDFRFAIKLSPYTAHMYFNRGNLYASMQQFDLAEKDYSKSLSLKPDDALVLKRRADVRGKLGMRADAIEDYRQAVEIQSRLRATK